ncbi:hypothetical protein D3C72_712540 [compost metagenome]
MAVGNQLAQRQTTTHFGVMGIARQQTVDRAVDNRQRCIEIRVAHAQQQDIDTLGAQLQRSVVNLPGSGSLPGDSLGQG